MSTKKQGTERGRALQSLRNGSRTSPVPARASAKRGSRSARKRRAVRDGW